MRPFLLTFFWNSETHMHEKKYNRMYKPKWSPFINHPIWNEVSESWRTCFSKQQKKNTHTHRKKNHYFQNLKVNRWCKNVINKTELKTKMKEKWKKNKIQAVLQHKKMVQRWAFISAKTMEITNNNHPKADFFCRFWVLRWKNLHPDLCSHCPGIGPNLQTLKTTLLKNHFWFLWRIWRQYASPNSQKKHTFKPASENFWSLLRG